MCRLHGECIPQSTLAEYLGDNFGVPLRYRTMSVDEYRAERVGELGERLGSVIAGIYAGIRSGAYDHPSDFATVAGRPHQSWADYFARLSEQRPKESRYASQPGPDIPATNLRSNSPMGWPAIAIARARRAAGSSLVRDHLPSDYTRVVLAQHKLASTCITAALLAAACGDDDPCDYRVCDIQSSECVKRVAEAVACHRDADVIVPDVIFASAAEVLGDPPAPTEQQLQDANDYWAGEALLGLMPVGYDAADTAADSLNNVVAFYSRDTKQVVIISDAVSPNRSSSYSVLVHEMIHVYQDAEYDLAALWSEHATTFDRGLGMRAGIEGEATWYQLVAQLDVDGAGPEDADWVGFFAGFQGSVLDAAQLTATPSLDVRGLFPYAFGGEQAYHAWLDGGADAISDLVRMPADSVRQVMAGYDARPPETFNVDTQLLPRAVPILPGHTLLGGGVQSTWLINAMLQRTAGSPDNWSTALSGIGADYLTVFRDDATGKSIAVWRIVDDADELRDALVGASSTLWTAYGTDQPATHLVADVDGDCVLIAAPSDATAILDALDGWETPEQAAERAGLDDSDKRGVPSRMLQRVPAGMPL